VTLPASLYEHLVTRGLSELARGRGKSQIERTPLEETEAPLRLTRHFASELYRVLRGQRGIDRQIALCNALLERLRIEAGLAVPREEDVDTPGELLLSLHDGQPPPRTELPFAVTTLLTNAHGEPALGHELSREIATAQTIDALVSFVTLSGFRRLKPAFAAHAQAGRCPAHPVARQGLALRKAERT